jgi:hypothetical protein
LAIGSDVWKNLEEKVVKAVAPIAVSWIPGPWQAPAIIYSKLESGYNIGFQAKVALLGDVMTVMAGGTQQVGGKAELGTELRSGDFAKEGGGTGFFDSAGKALKNIGSVDGKFNPLQYGKNIARHIRRRSNGWILGVCLEVVSNHILMKK